MQMQEFGTLCTLVGLSDRQRCILKYNIIYHIFISQEAAALAHREAQGWPPLKSFDPGSFAMSKVDINKAYFIKTSHILALHPTHPGAFDRAIVGATGAVDLN